MQPVCFVCLIVISARIRLGGENDNPILFGYLIRFKSSSIWLQTVLIEIWSFSTLTFSCHFYLICVCLFSLLFSLLFLFVNLSSAVNGFVCFFFSSFWIEMILFWMNQFRWSLQWLFFQSNAHVIAWWISTQYKI